MTNRQFSLRHLLLFTTGLCLTLALPGGWVVLLTVAGWAALVGVCLAAMVGWYSPIYRMIAGPARTAPLVDARQESREGVTQG